MYENILKDIDNEIERCEQCIDEDPESYDAYMNRIQGLLYACRTILSWQKVEE